MEELMKDEAAKRIAKLEQDLGNLRAEYNNLKIASEKRNAREAKVSQVVRNLSTLMELLAALEAKLPVAQQALLAVANGHELEKSVMFEAAEAIGKLAMRARRMEAELTVEG